MKARKEICPVQAKYSGNCKKEGEKRFCAPQEKGCNTERGVIGGRWIILHLGVL